MIICIEGDGRQCGCGKSFPLCDHSGREIGFPPPFATQTVSGEVKKKEYREIEAENFDQSGLTGPVQRSRYWREVIEPCMEKPADHFVAAKRMDIAI